MNHKELVAEGNRLSAVVEMQTSIINDPSTLPEQARQVAETGITHSKRLHTIANLLAADCTCGHSKDMHHKKWGKCIALQPADMTACTCQEWAVEA